MESLTAFLTVPRIGLVANNGFSVRLSAEVVRGVASFAAV